MRQGNVCHLSQPHSQRQRHHWEGVTTVQSPGMTLHRFLQRALAQVDDLGLVNMLEMCVNTRESSLGNFGESPSLSTPHHRQAQTSF